jgi:integrase
MPLAVTHGYLSLDPSVFSKIVSGKKKLSVKATVKSVEAAQIGHHHVDHHPGLYLHVAQGKTGVSRRFIFRYHRGGGKPNELSIGVYPIAVSLAEALDRWADLRRQVKKEKIDPAIARRQQRHPEPTTMAITVASALEQYRRDFAGAQGAQTTAATIERHAAGLLKLKIAEVKTSDIKAALAAVYAQYPKSAPRVRACVSRLMTYCIAHEWRDSDPAARATFKHLWQVPPPVVHHRSMPYAEVPAFFRQLLEVGSMSTLATAFVICTASRSGETIGATWDNEIDLEQRLWVVPAKRMKSRREWRQPLSDAALDVLDRARHRGGAWGHVFKGRSLGRLGARALEGCLHRGFGLPYSCHGFRASFSTAAREMTSFAHEHIEGCLAHMTGNAVSQSYNRGDALEHRKAIMQWWGRLVSGQGSS